MRLKKRLAMSLGFRVMTLSALVAAVVSYTSSGSSAQGLPDVALMIHGQSDRAGWMASAIGGHTIAGSYGGPLVAGAFTWDGKNLQTYPVVELPTGFDLAPYNQVFAVNAAGVAIGEHEVEEPPSMEGGNSLAEIPARFADGKTTFFNHRESTQSADGQVGGPYAVDARGDIAGLGLWIDPQFHTTPIAGLTTSTIGADVRPGAIDSRGNVAGTSTTLQAYGNRLTGPDPSQPHVFFARAQLLGAPARDVGQVPNCHAPVVRGLADDGTIVGTCTDETPAHHARAWAWRGTFRTLPPLPGDDEASVAATSPDGIIVGTSSRKDRTTAVLWRDGTVLAVSSLAPPPAGDTFERASGISDTHWIVVAGKHGDRQASFLVVPQADVRAAEAVAVIPDATAFTPAPAPTATGDAVSGFDSISTLPEPLPTAAPLTPTHVAAGPVEALRTLWTGVSPISPDLSLVVADGKRFYLAVPKAVEAFDASGALLWQHPFAGALAIAETNGTVVVLGPNGLVALDAASGRQRWSKPAAADANSVSLPTLSASGGIAHVAWVKPLAYDVATGRLAKPNPICEGAVEAAGVVMCRAGDGAYAPRVTTFYLAGTGHKFLSVGFNPTLIPGLASPVFGSAGDNIVIHPESGTYDALSYPGGSESAFDGKYVIYNDAGTGRRYRLDLKPEIQHPVPFPAGGIFSFDAGDGFEVNFASGGGPLNVISFDKNGTPAAVAYDGVTAATSGHAFIRGHLAFAMTAKGLAVVDLPAQRLLGYASIMCSQIQSIDVIGPTAVIGCENEADKAGRSGRLTAIDLGPKSAAPIERTKRVESDTGTQKGSANVAKVRLQAALPPAERFYRIAPLAQSDLSLTSIHGFTE